MGNELDGNILRWVKSEIDETLSQARTALETYVETPEDVSQLRFCVNYVHQVHGTLQMVELYGASLLAEEMEQLTQALIEGKVTHLEDAFEVLMRGMLQLPDYLERLLGGAEDIPMVLLPLLNDLRAAREAPLLSENALFTPDLDVQAPVVLETEEELEDIRSLARKLRHSYHLGLLDWFRDRNITKGLRRIGTVIETLRQAANDPDANRMLWVAGGVVEGLQQGGLETSVAVKLLMGQVDRQIKKIIDNGESELAENPPEVLVKNLLYYVARTNTTSGRPQELKEAFNLTEVLPDAHSLERARADLQGPNAALMETVSAVLMEDLLKVKDNLDVFVRSEERDINELKLLCESLAQMADTLGMLGLGIQRKTVQAQISVLNSMTEENSIVDETALMNVAGALLELESSLNELGEVRAANDAMAEQAQEEESSSADVIGRQIQGAEQRKLMQSVIAEAKVDMTRIKQALTDFSRSTTEHDLLSDVPETLGQIHGGLSMLGLDRAAGLLDVCIQYISNDLIKGKVIPDPATLDNLADGISSIEYYLESLAEGWGHPNSILDVAKQSLQEFGYVEAEVEASPKGESPETNEEPDREQVTVGPVAIDSETDTLVDLPVPEGLSLETELIPQVVSDEDSIAEAIEANYASEELKGELAEDLDDEPDTLTDIPANLILDPDEPEAIPKDEYFQHDIEVEDELSIDLSSDSLTLEGFDSELEMESGQAGIEQSPQEEGSAPKARSNQGMYASDESLSAMEVVDLSGPEDGLPSLDGITAGRVNEALTLWFEDVNDGTVTELLQEILGHVLSEAKTLDNAEAVKVATEMAAMVSRVADGKEPLTTDLQNTLRWGKDTLARLLWGAEAQSQKMTQESSAVSVPSSLQPTDINRSISTSKVFVPGDEIDDEIKNIFLEEAEEEQQKISKLLPVWQAEQGDENTLTELRRSFHTLKGSGRLVGAVDIGEFAWSFESMLNRVMDHTIQPSESMFELLQQGCLTLPKLFAMFRSGEKPKGEIFTLMEHANVLSRGEDIAPFDQTITDAPADPSAGPATPDQVEQNEAALLIPVIDPVLLDIYLKEVDTHLDVLKEYIVDWKENNKHDITHTLLRALHTLTGSARTAGVPPVADLCGLFEQYVKHLQQLGYLVNEATVTTLEDTVVFVTHVVASLNQPGEPFIDHAGLLQRVQALFDAVRYDTPTVELSISKDIREELVNHLDAAASIADSEPVAEYDDELLEIFLEEGAEILDECDHTLNRWIDYPDNPEHIEAMQRLLHTLKGGARMAGVNEVGNLSHSIESILTAVVDGHIAISPHMFDLLQRAHDKLAQMLEQVQKHETLQDAVDIIYRVNEMLGNENPEVVIKPVPVPNDEGVDEDETLGMESPAEIERQDSEEETPLPEETQATIATEMLEEVEETGSPAEEPADHLVDDAPKQADNVVALEVGNLAETAPMVPIEFEELEEERERRKASRVRHEQIRVRSDLLDNLVNFAGEVSIYRSRLDQQTNSFRYNLQELDETVERLREQLRKFEIEAEAQIQYRHEETIGPSYEQFDPLEFDRFTQMQQLSRGMLESLSDLDSLRGILTGLTRESETLLGQQARINTELQEGLMRTRLVPFARQATRFRRIVRQTSNELGKKVELQLFGTESEVDRTVMDRIMSSIEHILRNAVAHGIESPEARGLADKPETGVVQLSFSREGSDIIIQVKDDGVGIDLDAIREKAIHLGLIKADTNASKEMLFDIMMGSGFSTTENVTQISGRGVGMDVVNSEIRQLGGLINIDTEKGKGATFTISMPLTLAVTRALMFYVGEETYAVPLLSVESVERITGEELAYMQTAENSIYKWLEQDYQFMHLGKMMGVSEPSLPGPKDKVPLLLVRSGEFRAAFQIDGLIGSREIVVKPVGPQLSTLRGISGATIMGDGSVVFILDLGVLIRLMATQEGHERIETTPPAEVQTKPEEEHLPIIMVVDDSITVRKVTSRLLERNKMSVLAAKDGVDALAQLQDHIPDVMLLDIEMPRMDGFELAMNMRNDAALKDIPIIMITSRTGEKHRDHALDIGVDLYMGKPYNEVELLESIKALLKEQA